jgi:CRISPR/Cas system-associated endonuclease Cas1
MKTGSSKITQADIERALTSPPQVFDSPQEVLIVENLSHSQKIDILKRWEADARALQRATDENLVGGERPPLDEINEALSILDPEGKAADGFGKAPTKI